MIIKGGGATCLLDIVLGDKANREGFVIAEGTVGADFGESKGGGRGMVGDMWVTAVARRFPVVIINIKRGRKSDGTNRARRGI